MPHLGSSCSPIVYDDPHHYDPLMHHGVEHYRLAHYPPASMYPPGEGFGDGYEAMMERVHGYTPFHDDAARAARLVHGLHRQEAGPDDDLNRPPEDWASEFFPLEGYHEDSRFWRNVWGLILIGPQGLAYVLVSPTAAPALVSEIMRSPIPGTIEGSEVTTSDGETSILASTQRFPEMEEAYEEQREEEEMPDPTHMFGSEASTAEEGDYESMDPSYHERDEPSYRENVPSSPAVGSVPERRAMSMPQQKLRSALRRSRSERRSKLPPLPSRNRSSMRSPPRSSASTGSPPSYASGFDTYLSAGAEASHPQQWDLPMFPSHLTAHVAKYRPFEGMETPQPVRFGVRHAGIKFRKPIPRGARRLGRSGHAKSADVKALRSRKRQLAREKAKAKRDIRRQQRRIRAEKRAKREYQKRQRQIAAEEKEIERLRSQLHRLESEHVDITGTGGSMAAAVLPELPTGASAGDRAAWDRVRADPDAPLPRMLQSVPVALEFSATGEVTDRTPKDDVTRGELFHTKLLGYDDKAYRMAEDHALELLKSRFGLPTQKAVRGKDGVLEVPGAFKIEPYAVRGSLTHQVDAIRGFAGTASANATVHEGGWRATVTAPDGATLGGTWGGAQGKRVEQGSIMRVGRWHVDNKKGYGNDPLLIHFLSDKPLELSPSHDLDTPVREHFMVDYYDPDDSAGPIFPGSANRVIRFEGDPSDASKGTIQMNTKVVF